MALTIGHTLDDEAELEEYIVVEFLQNNMTIMFINLQ